MFAIGTPRPSGCIAARRRALGATLAFAATLSPRWVHAQQPSPPAAPSSPSHASTPDPRAVLSAADAMPEQGVTVIGSARSLERVPGAATYVSNRDVQRTMPMQPAEILRRVPGVYVRDEEGFGLRFNISLRGLDATRGRRVHLLEDGIPITLNPYSEPETYYHPPVERIHSVEVVRGAGSIVFGPQTIGGVINYITTPVPRRRVAEVRLQGGYPAYFSLRGVFGDASGPAGFIVEFTRRQGVGFRRMGFEVTDVFARARIELGRAHEILLRANWYLEDSHASYTGLTTSMFLRDPQQNSAPDDQMTVHRYAASITYTIRPNDDVRVQSLLYAYQISRDWWRQLYDRVPTADVAYQRIVGDSTCGVAGSPTCGSSAQSGALYLRWANRGNNRVYEVVGADLRMQGRFRTGFIRNELDVGARVLYETAVRRTVFGDSPLARAGEVGTDERRDGVALALYVQNRFFLTPEFQITPGVRFERYGYQRTIRRDGNVNVNRRGAGSDLTIIPGANIAYGTHSVTAFAGVHLGYAPPSIATAVDPRTGVDLALDAERSMNYEVGTRLTIGSWLRAEATLFAIDFQNEVVPGSFAGGSIAYEFVNGGRTRYLGLESLAQIELGRALRIPTNVIVGARYTFVDARFMDDPRTMAQFVGHHVPYAVPHALTTSVAVEHPSGFGAQASWLVVGDHFTDAANTDAPTPSGLAGRIPAFNALDVSAWYRHRATGLGFALAVKNATDVVYVASRLPEGIFPGGFRQIIGTLSWQLP